MRANVPACDPARGSAWPSRLPGVSALSDRTGLLATWREIADCHSRVSCALDKALERQHGLGLTEFEVLEQLVAADEGKRRMQELADTVHLSQSALSRLVSRLEAVGLVQRCTCDSDRRGIYTQITAAGRERCAAAQPTHRAVLAETLPAPAAAA
jgi:DNA-binding MarR family transcriptional regulator